MGFPEVKLHRLHSLHLYDGLYIIFDLKLLDVNKNECISNMFRIDTIEKSISICGYKLSDSTFIINSNGNIINIPYTCSNDDITTGIEYLHQIYKNIVKSEDNIKMNIWNPKPYKPDE